MKIFSILTPLLLAVLLVTSSLLAQEQSKIQSDILNNSGKKIGELTLTQGTIGVLVHIKAKGLTPGFHGMHFHTVGDCSDHAHFKNAKGHIDPHQKPHGFLNPQGPHEGNLPNLIVAQNGEVEVELHTQMVHLTNGDAALQDSDGSTLIIHTSPDDHMTQPIGGAGARVACAVIK